MIRTVSLNGVAAASAAGNGRGDMAAAPDAACSFTDVDVATRISLVDAHTAFIQVKKGKATGNRYALWLRWKLQQRLFRLGCFIQKHHSKVLFVGILLLSLCCVGLKRASLQTNIERLWIEEGGRLSKELNYTQEWLGEGSGTTYEIIIQVSNDDSPSNQPTKDGSGISSNRNILNAKSLLRHLDAVLAATRLTVDVYDKTWRFNNLCYAASFPNFDDDGFINQILTKLEPCVIISPLDCFWEGSKLLGPDYGVYIPGYGYDIKWSNLNPEDAVGSMPGLGSNFRNQAEDLLQMAGITTGYQFKPCLNPEDVDCPPTAPNYRSKQVPDVMAELTGGCQGVSTKYLSWEEDLLIGGATHDSTDQLSSGKALQTLLQLMGEKDLYDYWANTQQTYGLDWTVDKARQVLDTWRRKFTQVVLTSQNSTSPDRVVAMSSLDVADVMDDFSQLNVLRIIVGCLLVCIYACAALVNLSDSVQSQAAVGLAGVFLVILSVAAGLGLCSAVGVQFNAASTQILPFLAVSIGMDDVFLVAHTFKLHAVRTDIDYMDQTGECLKRIGVTVVLTSLCNACAFILAAIIPLPAMRAFCLQGAVVVIFNMISVLVVYPAVISLDLVRRRKNRVDFFVCFTWSGIRSSDPASSSSLSSPTVGSDGRTMGTYSRHDAVRWSQHPTTSDSAAAGRLARPQQFHNVVAATNADGCYPTSKLAQRSSRDSGFWNVPSQTLPSTVSSASLPELGTCKCCASNTSCAHIKPRLRKWSLTRFARDFYAPLLQKTAFKVAVIVVGIGLVGASAFGVYLIRDGLDITDIVPRDTTEHQFLDAQSKYFGFYNFYAVTQQHFDYTSADNQKLLYAYHQSFIKVGNIIKQEDGSLPEFWLQQFRAWLIAIQSSFDKDVASGRISRSGWNSNATVDGRLGYKLIVQTGQPSNPIDRNRVDSGRLVSSMGIIYPPAFYVYLSAWVSNDAMAYTSSQSALRPHPKQWLHDEFDTSLEIPASQPLAYTQLAFYLHNLGSTENITNTIKDIRDICESYVVQGLPNYPQGIIFTFWEQYINLRFYLVFALVAVFMAVFVVLSITLLNPWAAAIVAVVLGVTVVELFGLMGLTGIKLSAIPAVTLVITAGIGVEFTVYITLNFLSAIGSSRDMRVAIALESSFAPVIHGAISTLLGIIMLAGSQFDFIVRYFFMILTLLVGLGLLNGVVLLPVLLSIAGPRPEVVALNNADFLSAAPSQKSVQRKEIQYHRKRSRSRQAAYTRRREELSTIAEESSQHQSSISPADDLSSISVEVEQPEIVVETVTSSQPQISIQPMVHSATIPQVPPQPPPPYSGSAPPHLSSANVGGCCMCNPARCQSYQLPTPLPQYQGIPISSTAQFQGIPLTTAAVSSTAPFHSFPAVSETTTSYYGVPMASAATNSSTSTVSSTSSGRHVTTIRTTARVKVEVHTPVPSFSQSPDFKSRRRKRARVDRPITSFGSSTDS